MAYRLKPPALPATLTEVKFDCPHCGQRIACDPAYGGTTTPCPTCSQQIQIPLLRPRVHTLAVGATAPRVPARLAATFTGESVELPVGFLALLVAPPVLFLSTVALGATAAPVARVLYPVWIVLAVACALLSGFMIARSSTPHPLARILLGLPLAACIAAVYLVVCFFGGCCAAACGA